MAFSTKQGFGYWNYLDDDIMESDYPLSTYYAWAMRNNLAHLMDSAGQFRIHWMGKPGRDDAVSFTGNTSGVHYWSQMFPVTLLSNLALPGLDIRIAGAVANVGDSLNLKARLVAANEPVIWSKKSEILWPVNGTPASATITSTTGAFGIDTQVQGIQKNGWKTGIRTLMVEEDTVARAVITVLLRLECKLTVTAAGSYTVYISGCQVREFPVWL